MLLVQPENQISTFLLCFINQYILILGLYFIITLSVSGSKKVFLNRSDHHPWAIIILRTNGKINDSFAAKLTSMELTQDPHFLFI